MHSSQITPTPAPGKLALGDALDVLASLVRSFGRVAFEIGEARGPAVAPGEAKADVRSSLDVFALEADRWARRILIGVGAEQGLATGADIAELRRWFESRRKGERQYVEDNVGGFRTAVSNLVRGVRGLLAEDMNTDADIDAHLARLERAAAAGQVDLLTVMVPAVVEGIRGSLDKRRKTFREQLRSMGEAMSRLREDLETTRQEVELDALTRVTNRGGLDKAIEKTVLLAAGTGTTFLVVMVDLDHFKSLNDQHGHAAGDAVLRATADALVRTFPRRDDLVARYGGEEFCILVRDADPPTAERLTARLLDNIRQARPAAPHGSLQVTASVGVATWRPGEPAASVLARADAAMYAAKHGGRDRVVHA
ncbi:MAG: GGDEF domain-containing protein [Myxococcales bacterium]|nr:GGDEF domain-containing protein [Myxococcales bacterium]